MEELRTIDDIPVEWIKRKSLESNNPFNAYIMVLFAWYKEQMEQEAR